MASVFHGLNTAYTGLSASQKQVETASHNISNANNEFYTRQRAVQEAKIPLNETFGDLGQGTQITTIKRLHDDFVYERYRKASEEKEYTGFTKSQMDNISALFPDMENIGVYNDMEKYFKSWSELSSNPRSSANKEALKSQTEILTAEMQKSRENLFDEQTKINKQMKTLINEANELIKKISDINVKIRNNESGRINNANDLRDERDKYEMALSKIFDVKVYKEAHSDSTMPTFNADWDENYVLNIGGFTFIDDKGYNKIDFNTDKNPYGFGTIDLVRISDLKRFEMTSGIKGGEMGAMLDMRGRTFDVDKGEFLDGKIQKYIDNLDTVAKGLIESTNTIYAHTASDKIKSDVTSFSKNQILTNLNKEDYNIRTGSFDFVMYDASGSEVARKTISIDNTTNMEKILHEINRNSDDNTDEAPLNDIDDEFTASFANNQLSIIRKDNSKGFTLGIEDRGTNFAGALGINRFFEGKTAKEIKLSTRYLQNPDQIQAGLTKQSGDPVIANKMQQLQYDNIEFVNKKGGSNNQTLSYMYNLFATDIATDGAEAKSYDETKTSIYNTIKQEQDSISKVSIDEELTELIKFQTAYQANAKVMNTINTILDSLLGIKS